MFSIKCPLFEILTTIVKFKAFFLCLRSRTSITQLAFFRKNSKVGNTNSWWSSHLPSILVHATSRIA